MNEVAKQIMDTNHASQRVAVPCALKGRLDTAEHGEEESW